MRALKLALTAIGISLALAVAGPGQAQQQNTFPLRVCNNYNQDVIMALAHRVSANPSEKRFVVRGWVALKSQECGDGEFPRGWFYYFAIAVDGSKYWGGDVGVCVSFKGPFERIHNDNYACKADGEVIAPFAGVQVVRQPGIALTFND